MDKKKYQEYSYVVISTLNQVVNVIPHKIYQFDEVYNITITDSPYFKNEEFNKNLGLNFKETLDFQQTDMNNVAGIVTKLKAFFSEKKRIFWNITGGQRPFILAILEFIRDREDDVICYLEGNSSTMTITGKEGSKEYRYHQSYVSIEEALKLMGFDFRKIDDSKQGKDDERDFYYKLYALYIDKNNVQLRKEFIELNSNKKACKDFVANSHFKKELEIINFCQYTEDDFKQTYPFGYILEKLAFYQLEKEIKSKVESLVHSLKIIFNDEEKQKEINGKTIDEFDIAILTKNGKFIIFECKSGKMSGDVAKSTNYSTYAISGVYGKPILITPLIEDEIKKINGLDGYGKVKSAIKSAKRATLDVWGIDKIADNIENYIK